MKTTHSGMIETVKDQIVAAIKGTGNIVQATVDTVAQILATTIKDTGKVGTSVTDVIASVASGAIRGAAHIDADLGHVAKGIMIGVLRGTKDAGTEVLKTISHTAHVAIQDTAAVGGDLKPQPPGLSKGRSKAPRTWVSVPKRLRRLPRTERWKRLAKWVRRLLTQFARP